MTAEEAESVEITVRGFRKVGRPTERKHWLVVIGTMIQKPDDMIAEFQRQGRILGVEWIVQVTIALLEEIAAGNTYRDEQNCLRLIDKSRAERMIELLT